MNKRIFVLGDRISIHCGVYLEKFLEGSFLYYRKGRGLPHGDLDVNSEANGGDSQNVMQYLQSPSDKQYDILLLNWRAS